VAQVVEYLPSEHEALSSNTMPPEIKQEIEIALHLRSCVSFFWNIYNILDMFLEETWLLSSWPEPRNHINNPEHTLHTLHTWQTMYMHRGGVEQCPCVFLSGTGHTLYCIFVSHLTACRIPSKSMGRAASFNYTNGFYSLGLIWHVYTRAHTRS
jgi:hypothetical protein